MRAVDVVVEAVTDEHDGSRVRDAEAVRRAYERVGFVEEGLQHRAFYKRGTWYDLLHMALVPAE